MGNFAGNLDVGKRVLPPLIFFARYPISLFVPRNRNVLVNTPHCPPAECEGMCVGCLTSKGGQ